MLVIAPDPDPDSAEVEAVLDELELHPAAPATASPTAAMAVESLRRRRPLLNAMGTPSKLFSRI
jgi:hypothetical protein